MFYSLLADLVVCVHVGYVAYVVLGQLFIWIGLLFGWKCVRNPWFRWTHMLAIAIVAGEVALNLRCPLTVWEEQLRVLAGEPVSGQSFVGRLFHAIIFYEAEEWVFDTMHVGFCVLVLGTLICFPPRRFRAKS